MKEVKAMTATERSRKHREQRAHDGWRLIQVWLNPPAAATLERLEDSGHTTQTAIHYLLGEDEH